MPKCRDPAPGQQATGSYATLALLQQIDEDAFDRALGAMDALDRGVQAVVASVPPDVQSWLTVVWQRQRQGFLTDLLASVDLDQAPRTDHPEGRVPDGMIVSTPEWPRG